MAAELRVRIDWGNSGGFDLPSVAYCDVSDHVVSVRYERGKSSITRSFAAGRATIELTNDDDRYSPWNRYSVLTNTGSQLVTDTAWGGRETIYLRPGHLVEIMVIDGATTYQRFTGWIDRLAVRGPRGASRTCVIYATDALGLLDKFKFSLAMQANVAADTLIGTVLNQAALLKPKGSTWFTTDIQGTWNGFDNAPLFDQENAFVPRSIDSIPDVIPYAWWNQVTVRAALDDIMTAMGASYFVEGDGTIIVHSRYHEQTAARSLGQGPRGTWIAQQTLQSEVIEDEQELADADVINVAHVTSQAYKPQASPSTLWSLQSQQIPIALQPGEYVPIHVAYSAPASAVTTPVSTTDYTASANSDGTGADKTGSLAPNFTAYGASADFNLQNTDSVVIYVQKLQIRGTAMDAQLAIIDERVDDQSQADYHLREGDYSSPLIQSRALGASLATQIVLTKGVPRANPKIRLLNDQSAAILGALLGDSVEVRYASGNWDPFLGDPEDAPNRYRRYHLWGIADVIRPLGGGAGIDIESTWLLVEGLYQAGGRDFFRFDVGPGFDRGLLIW